MAENIRETLLQVAELYSQNLAEHGLSSKALGWKDEEGQLLRFKKLCSIFESDDNQNVSVNDLGSGLGGLFHYLQDIHHVNITKYYGYEISQSMLDMADQNILDPRVEFIHSDEIIHCADFSFASGIFNVKFSAAYEDWDLHVKKTLHHMTKMSKKGIAFNILSSYVDWQEEHLFYADPKIYFDYCKKNISKYVTVLHDYPLYEWTMIIRL